MGAKAPIGLEIAATYQSLKRTGFEIASIYGCGYLFIDVRIYRHLFIDAAIYL